MNLDVLRTTPVLDFDVKDGRLAYILWEEAPQAYIHGVGKIDLEEPETVHWVNGRLAIVADEKGKEVRSIYLYDQGVHPVLSDGYDNLNPHFLKEDRFYFVSNRDGKTLHLYLYDGGEIVKVSKGELPVSQVCVSPMGRWVAYSQGIYDDDIWIIDNKTGEERKLSFPNSEDLPASQQCFWGDYMLFLSNVNGFYDVGKLNLKDFTWDFVVKSELDKTEATVWRGNLVYTVNRKGDISLIHGEKEIIAEGEVRDLKVDNSLYFIHSSHERDWDLYRFDGKMERVTDSMRGVRGDFVRPQLISYDSEGVEVDALLYSRGKERMGVVYVHGGPDYECLNHFSPTIQLLLDEGFKVICPNYRGSTGRGRRFNHLNDMDLGGGDLRDVVRAADLLKVEKVAITGGSYGGYLTMMAVTKYPEKWCAAAAVVPFVNWFTEKEKEREVLRQYDEVKIGSDENILRDRSPIFFVDKIRAPLLLLAGENDPRCPAEETMQVIEKMKELGRKVEFKIYHDEGHGFTKRENYTDHVMRVVKFLTEQC